LVVGARGIADLTITDGAQLFSGNNNFNAPAIIAEQRDSYGSVLVDGANSLWRHQGEIAVGSEGVGVVNVTGGGRVISQELVIGGGPSRRGGPGTGIVTIDGPGSEWFTQGLYVGQRGAGELYLKNGASLINSGF